MYSWLERIRSFTFCTKAGEISAGLAVPGCADCGCPVVPAGLGPVVVDPPHPAAEAEKMTAAMVSSTHQEPFVRMAMSCGLVEKGFSQSDIVGGRTKRV